MLRRIFKARLPSQVAPNAKLSSSRRNRFNPLVASIMDDSKDSKDSKDEETNSGNEFAKKCIETIGITFSSIAILAISGYVYHKAYDYKVLKSMSQAFENGDSVSKLLGGQLNVEKDPNWILRPQQLTVDRIVSGELTGSYFLFFGEKGTGKTSLILESIKRARGHNVIIFDAHADPEIFRIRLGKAINFSFNEDYIGSLFSMRGPRDTTALLDIERAFNKLEELSLQNQKKNGKEPLVMIINHSHLIKDNEEGVKLLELLQQKAESLCGAGLLTLIFNSDDYWVYEKLKRLGTKLELINVRDFTRSEAVQALKHIRLTHFAETLNEHECNIVYNLIGGRPQHLAQVAKHPDILKACNEIIDREKTWFLNQCGLLGMDMDDDVMEFGKFSSAAMTLMKEFVDMDKHSIISGGDRETLTTQDHALPELPLWRSRQILTRADYMQQYDNLNIFTLDSESRVRADSVPMMRAFHEIALQANFDRLLEDTITRVCDIESLGRTREIVMKDLTLGSKYRITTHKAGNLEILIDKSRKESSIHGDFKDFNNAADDEDEDFVGLLGESDDDDLFMEHVQRNESKKIWKKRLLSVHPDNPPVSDVELMDSAEVTVGDLVAHRTSTQAFGK